MSRLAIALTFLVLTLSACGPLAAQASPDASQPPSGPAVSPSAPPDPASPDPTESPATPTPPSVPTTGPTVSPAPDVPTADEQYLIDGVRRDAIDCRPVDDPLPDRALAGIECRSDDPAVARVGFYLFANDDDMLDVYFARMGVEGVITDSGGCTDQEGEAAYIPEDAPAPDRNGCFVNDQGYANYRATISGNHVYIGILGRSANMRALADFAWRGNQDVPGVLTLWGDPGR